MRQRRESAVDLHLFEMLHLYVHSSLPLIPPGIALARLTSILDIGCGLHLWGRDLFRAMVEQGGHDLVTDVHIEGIGHHREMVRQANRQMRAGRGRVTALVGDMFHLPADFSDRYDLVHVRFLAPYVAPLVWSALFEEVVRVCKPGGWVVWSEPALPTKGERTPGWNQWLDWIEQAIRNTGGSPHISASMEEVFRQVGSWHGMEVQKTSILLHSAMGQGYLTIDQTQILHRWLQALHSLLLAARVASPRLLAQGHHQVEEELVSRAVSSHWDWYTLSGRTC
jgi:SAM-dependent methyltransferase